MGGGGGGALFNVPPLYPRKVWVFHLNWNWELFSNNLAQIWIWNSSQKHYQGFQIYEKRQKESRPK